ncbi:TonB-dependent receptor [Candidatus Poribacteria bacterium]|nr:TonB-dependent receptor [Candidatus Poribacteria bacterium]
MKPEESASFDFGVEQRLFNGVVKAGVTYFQTTFDNLIAAVLVDPEKFIYRAANIESAESSGVEVDATLQPLDGVTLIGSYTYVDAKDTSKPDEEKPLRRRPKHTGRLNLNYALPVGLNMNLDVVFVGRRPDFIPGVKTKEMLLLPSYTTVNFGVAYAAGRTISIFGKVTNLTDENYQEVVGYPTLGRQIIGGASVGF